MVPSFSGAECPENDFPLLQLWALLLASELQEFRDNRMIGVVETRIKGSISLRPIELKEVLVQDKDKTRQHATGDKKKTRQELQDTTRQQEDEKGKRKKEEVN